MKQKKPAAQCPDPAITRSVHVWALGALLVLTTALALLFYRYAQVDLWEGWVESEELRKTRYSETVYIQSIFRTRANTWSNLAFVLVGLYALATGIQDHRRKESSATPPSLTLLFGLACCYLGLGSGIFHASLTRWGQQLDVASMYPPMLTLIAMLARRNLSAALRLSKQAADAVTGLLITLVLVAAVLLYLYKWSMSSAVVLPLHIGALAAACFIDRRYWRPTASMHSLVGSFIALLAGVLCRQLDVAGQFSGPDAWYQGHSFWHLLCALSLALAWLYVREGDHKGRRTR